VDSFWEDLTRSSGNIRPDQIGLRLLVSAVCGFVIAAVYRRSLGRAATESFATAIVLLSVLVAMTTMVIGDSVARAFSLVGALAIVRFRTNVEDTRDTAFVIFAVVAGMASGVGNWMLLLAGVPVVAVLALLRPRAPDAAPAAPEIPLLVRIGTGDDPKALDGPLDARLASRRLLKTATARQGAAIELTWSVRMKDGGEALDLVAALNGVKGVQHVELGEA
jgi:hypothetical protein